MQADLSAVESECFVHIQGDEARDEHDVLLIQLPRNELGIILGNLEHFRHLTRVAYQLNINPSIQNLTNISAKKRGDYGYYH